MKVTASNLRQGRRLKMLEIITDDFYIIGGTDLMPRGIRMTN